VALSSEYFTLEYSLKNTAVNASDIELSVYIISQHKYEGGKLWKFSGKIGRKFSGLTTLYKTTWKLNDLKNHYQILVCPDKTEKLMLCKISTDLNRIK